MFFIIWASLLFVDALDNASEYSRGSIAIHAQEKLANNVISNYDNTIAKPNPTAMFNLRFIYISSAIIGLILLPIIAGFTYLVLPTIWLALVILFFGIIIFALIRNSIIMLILRKLKKMNK